MVTAKASFAYCAGMWILLGASCAWAQFSPGRMSAAHRSLEGPTKCAACHGVKAVNGDFKCLSCHREIRERLASKRGLHATQVKQTLGQRDCARCHGEHNGEHFVPIRWDVDLSEFDHGKTGYQLEGGHHGLECRKCHLPKNIPLAERRNIVTKDLRRTYLGLTRECANCHGDAHRGQLSSDCLRCHTYLKWKPASRFEHAQAKYQLSGAHLKVPCEKCHQRTASDTKPYAKFTGVAFSSCDSCHKDPHRGAFQAACQSCHSADAWKPAHPASQFDHSRAKFALLGRHTQVACGKCHLTSNFKEPVAHANCVDCHKTDVHRGQFASRPDRGECSTCHGVDGWKPSKFDLAAHRTTPYPLEGRHAAVPCAKCHTPAGQATIYRVKSGQCSDCHADSHQAQFAGPPHGNRCEDCHVVKGFRPSTYSLAQHSASRFSLAGAHLAVACAECHYRQAGGRPPAGRFHFPDTSCTTCHEDPHRGQFHTGLRAQGAGCESCHDLRFWRDVSKFDHASTSFPLKGTHRAAPCEKCHPPADPGLGIKSVTFRSAPKLCSGCHEDIHSGQFATGSAGTDCGRCHASLQWKPALFDHDRTTRFALTGAHKGVPCVLCHKTGQQANGRTVMLFKSAPKECTGCHGPKVNG